MKNKKESGKKLQLKTSQKFKIRIIIAASLILSLATGIFIYINLTSGEQSKAATSTYRPNYRTTDANVPVRLLLKPDSNAQRVSAGVNPKTETGYKQVRLGRTQEISNERYISE